MPEFGGDETVLDVVPPKDFYQGASGFMAFQFIDETHYLAFVHSAYYAILSDGQRKRRRNFGLPLRSQKANFNQNLGCKKNPNRPFLLSKQLLV